MSIVVKQRPSSASAAQLFSPIPACFRRPRSSISDESKDVPSSTSTSVYATDFGACVLTWTRTLLGRTLRIQLQDKRFNIDYTLKIRSKPFLFWRNEGAKVFEEVQILWDFGRCRFGSETEPETGFYLAVVVGGEVVVFVGDMVKSAHARLRLGCGKEKRTKQRLVFKKEHVNGTRFFRATAAVGGGRKVRILIEHFYSGRDSGLRFSFNGFCVMEIENLVWKFRGNEQIEFEGVAVNVSWDVHGWLFTTASTKKKKEAAEASGVFVFDFEKVGVDCCDVGLKEEGRNVWERMRRSEILSLSSISSSGSSWGSSSSVMDWYSVEEKEMECGGGFSLVVYATKS
ncbi:hypothetical protein QQ045_003336 [Rhodiola kirilowii]